MVECEDCGEYVERRIRCKRCGLMVCPWCANHVHVEEIQMVPDPYARLAHAMQAVIAESGDGDDAKAQKIKAAVDAFGHRKEAEFVAHAILGTNKQGKKESAREG